MTRYRAMVEIDLNAPNEDAVDDIIHASVELGGELPPGSTVWTFSIDVRRCKMCGSDDPTLDQTPDGARVRHDASTAPCPDPYHGQAGS